MKFFKATSILLLQLSLASATYNTPALTNGLVAHYPLNGDVIDIISGNNGAMYGSISSGVAYRTYATLNGIDNYIEIPAANQFIENKAKWTISYWIRVNDNTTSHSFLSKRDYCGFENGFDMRGKNIMKFENLKANQHGNLYTPISIRLGWELITIVKNNDVYTSYANGIQQDRKTFLNSTFTNGDLSISNSPCITSPDGTERLKGDVDDLRIYDRVLHAREILILYRTTNPDMERDIVSSSAIGVPIQTFMDKNITNNGNTPVSISSTPRKTMMSTNNNSTGNKNDNTVSPEDIIISKDGKSWRFKTKDDK